MAQLSIPSWSPQTPTDKQAVADQLHRLLAHPLFKNSKRCTGLLAYIVEHGLSGDSRHLKERAIGNYVFNREDDYDTSSDPVVRNSASELRKRIALYYHEPGHSNELRIELPIGSYTPMFQLPPSESSPESPSWRATARLLGFWFYPRRLRRQRILYLALASFAVAGVSVAMWNGERKPSSLNQFWSQIDSSPGPVLFCIGTRDAKPASEAIDPSLQTDPHVQADFRDVLPITDAMAFSGIAAFLEGKQKAYRVQTARATTISDLMQGPVVAIGAFDNSWTLRITEPLRFHLVGNHEDVHYIADRKSPSSQYVEMQNNPGRDFAIVARIFDSTTGQFSVVAAGLGAAGTTAGGKFLTSTNDMDDLLQRIPKNSGSRNIEAVISVPVIDDTPGAPHIEAVEVW